MSASFPRTLRKHASYPERILWNSLRNRFLRRFKFRRQEQLGPYVVDFVCYERRLVIELDGPHHEKQKVYDMKRDEWLISRGFVVLRIKNEDFLGNGNSILTKIERALGTPSP
jgi:very-short-patch-repair endonuclease